MRVCQLPLACWTRIQLTPRSKVVPLAILRLPATLPPQTPISQRSGSPGVKTVGEKDDQTGVFFLVSEPACGSREFKAFGPKVYFFLETGLGVVISENP